jgi:hypothetical protein
MMNEIDSTTVGDPARFRSLADLQRMLAALPDGREDAGNVALLMRRLEGGRRETLAASCCSRSWVFQAMPGDAPHNPTLRCRSR